MKIKGYSGIVLSEDMHHLLTLEERRMNYNKKKWKSHCVLYAELHDYMAVDFRSTRKIDLIPLKIALEEALSEATDKQLKVIELLYRGYNLTETGKLLGISDKAVERSRCRLQNCMLNIGTRCFSDAWG